MADIRKGVANVNKKHYGVIAVVALMYCSVAAGAFGIEEMISTCGPGMTIIALVGMVFVWAIPDCFCVAEVGSVLPAEGGDIFWAKHTLGNSTPSRKECGTQFRTTRPVERTSFWQRTTWVTSLNGTMPRLSLSN